MSHETFLERMMRRVWVPGLLQFLMKWLRQPLKQLLWNSLVGARHFPATNTSHCLVSGSGEGEKEMG